MSNQGKTTFFNSTDLGILCDLGYIKSENEVLCVSKVDPNFAENKLISIDLTTKKKMDIYTSKNLITAVSVINNQTYLGVNDLYTKKNYLLVGNKQIDFPDIASFIYVMNVKPYIASMKSALNDSQESYYLLSSDNFTKQAGKIMLSEQK